MPPSDLGIRVVLSGGWGLQLMAPVKFDAWDKHLVCQVCLRQGSARACHSQDTEAARGSSV